MGGRSLPFWVVILIAGVLVIFLMGAFSPFVTKEEKKRAEKFTNLMPTSVNGLTINVRFRFGGMAYLVIGIFFSLATLTAFFVESFTNFKNRFFNGGAWGYVVALIIVFIATLIIECVLIVIPLLAEDKAVNSIVAKYNRRYHATVVVNNHECN